MLSSSVDFAQLLEVLAQAGVQFVVIGGMSATLQGVPYPTYDLDIVLDPDDANLDRAFGVIQELDGSYREQLPKLLLPKRTDLGGRGAMLLMTRLGPLDILGEVATGWGYSDMLSRVERIRLSNGHEVRILNLESLIKIKEQLARPKDLKALDMYRDVLRERSAGRP